MNKDRVIIIAEAGVNHNGSLERAKELIIEASKAGADYIKFQTFKAETLVSKDAKKADYQVKNTGDNSSQFDMLKKLELSEKDHFELMDLCKEYDIKFMSSPFDIESIKFLDRLDLDFFKIPSGEITNYPFLKEIAKYKKPVILSTGMSNMDDIANALDVLRSDDIVILHCNTEYPTPMEHVNLNAMKTIKDKFNLDIGYSDHTIGIEVPIAAVALGARVIEKHFTLDKNLPGPDHKASLDPKELTAMVSGIRNIESALGSFNKIPSPSEEKNIKVARKSIVASCDIQEGSILNEGNLTTMRPGEGLSPMLWTSVIGTTAKRSFRKHEAIEL